MAKKENSSSRGNKSKDDITQVGKTDLKSSESKQPIEKKTGNKIETQPAQEDSQKKMLLIGSSLGIFVLIVGLFGAIYIFTELESEPLEEEVIVLERRSPDEIKLDEMLNDVDEGLNSIDANEDFSEFEDAEFAIESDEEELESAIDDIDQMMSDLEDLESGLEDFDDNDF